MPSSRPTKPALGGGGLHAHGVDWHAEGGGHVCAHLLAVRGELGGLRRDGAVHVRHAPAAPARQGGDLAHEAERVSALVGGVGVREEPAYVPGSQGAEHRVHHGMCHHVGVRVASQPAHARHVDAAQHQLATLGKRVNVKPMSDAHHVARSLHMCGRQLPPQDLLAVARHHTCQRRAGTGARARAPRPTLGDATSPT